MLKIVPVLGLNHISLCFRTVKAITVLRVQIQISQVYHTEHKYMHSTVLMKSDRTLFPTITVNPVKLCQNKEKELILLDHLYS